MCIIVKNNLWCLHDEVKQLLDCFELISNIKIHMKSSYLPNNYCKTGTFHSVRKKKQSNKNQSKIKIEIKVKMWKIKQVK